MAGAFEWQPASPAGAGMSAAKLDAMRDRLAERGTKTLLVIRNDRIVCEWYAADFGPAKRHYTASLAKALVGGMSLSLALNDGLMDVDDPAWKFIPCWKDHARKSRITIRHLATHTSGIEDSDNPRIPANDPELIGTWKGVFWPDLKSFVLRPELKARVPSPDPFRVARDEAPVLFEPGSDFAYSNPGMAMLSYAITAAIQPGPHKDVRTLLRERVMRPIGVADDEWSIGYEGVVGPGGAFEVDGLRLVDNWGGASYTARAVARVGRLMLRKGDWQGAGLIGEKWIAAAVTYAGLPGSDKQDTLTNASGLGWWTNAKGDWGGLPRDAFAGAGHNDQILLVVPSLDLIVVRNGVQLGESFGDGLTPYLFDPLMDALTAPGPTN